jgi:hypothetical protein
VSGSALTNHPRYLFPGFRAHVRRVRRFRESLTRLMTNRDILSAPTRTIAYSSQIPTERPSLDETIAATTRVLPDLRALTPEQLRALATNLRILSNVAEAWAHRADSADQPDE